MAKFTAPVPLRMRWAPGIEIDGAAGATHRIPDALLEEFIRDVVPAIPGGVTWLSQDETSAIAGFLTSPIAKSDVTGLVVDLAALTAADAALTAAKYDKTGGTISGSVLAQQVGGVVYADQYSSLAAALTAGAGRTVFVPAGTYALSGTVQPASGTRIVGVGPGSKITMSANQPIIQCAASATGIIIEGLWLVGSATTASSSAFGVYAPTGCADIIFRDLRIDTCYRGVSITGANRVRVENCTLNSDKSNLGAIDVSASTDVTVTNCRVLSPATIGIDFREGGGFHKAIGCSVRSSGQMGYVISGSSGTGVVINGCEIIGCESIIAGVTDSTQGVGFHVENGAQYTRLSGCFTSAASLDGILVAKGTGDRPVLTSIVNCIVANATRHGIYDFDTHYTTITGCQVDVFGSDGIRISTTQQITGFAAVSDCIVADGSLTTGAAYRVTGSGEGAMLTGCAARFNAGYGFYIDVPKTVVSGCTCIDADVGGALTIGGITLTANADRSVVSGCTSYRSSGTKQDYGVDVQSGCVSAVVTSCILTPNTTGTLLDNGTTTSTNNNIAA